MMPDGRSHRWAAPWRRRRACITRDAEWSPGAISLQRSAGAPCGGSVACHRETVRFLQIMPEEQADNQEGSNGSPETAKRLKRKPIPDRQNATGNSTAIARIQHLFKAGKRDHEATCQTTKASNNRPSCGLGENSKQRLEDSNQRLQHRNLIGELVLGFIGSEPSMPGRIKRVTVAKSRRNIHPMDDVGSTCSTISTALA